MDALNAVAVNSPPRLIIHAMTLPSASAHRLLFCGSQRFVHVVLNTREGFRLEGAHLGTEMNAQTILQSINDHNSHLSPASCLQLHLDSPLLPSAGRT